MKTNKTDKHTSFLQEIVTDFLSGCIAVDVLKTTYGEYSARFDREMKEFLPDTVGYQLTNRKTQDSTFIEDKNFVSFTLS
jgi:hypothetical protein